MVLTPKTTRENINLAWTLSDYSLRRPIWSIPFLFSTKSLWCGGQGPCYKAILRSSGVNGQSFSELQCIQLLVLPFHSHSLRAGSSTDHTDGNWLASFVSNTPESRESYTEVLIICIKCIFGDWGMHISSFGGSYISILDFRLPIHIITFRQTGKKITPHNFSVCLKNKNGSFRNTNRHTDIQSCPLGNSHGKINKSSYSKPRKWSKHLWNYTLVREVQKTHLTCRGKTIK